MSAEASPSTKFMLAGTPLSLDHLSHSQIQTFTGCPRKWHYDKILHAEKERVSSALVFGCAVHGTLATIHEAALHGDRVDPEATFVNTWKKQVAEAGAPISYGKDNADDLLAKGKALVVIYQPPSGIIGVEQPFTVDLDPALPPIEGYIDLIRRLPTGELILADIKTAATRMLTETDAVEAQLGLYDLAYPASACEAVVLAKLKAPVITVQPIIPWRRDRLVRHYQEVYHAMQAGVRYACRGWQCDGCSFSERCRRDG